MRNQILRTFNQGRDGDLVTIAHRVVLSLKENASFPNPPKPISTLEQAMEEYRLALSNAVSRDKAMVAIKDEKRTALRALLAELADYVNSVSNGNKGLLLTSGFECVRERGEITLQPINALEVVIGPPGQATTRTKRITGARTYMHEYTTDPTMSDNTWTTKLTSERAFNFSGLASGVKHWFRVKAVGRGGVTVESPVVSRYIQ